MSRISIEAVCEILTPMLASGENQQKFELRASEVKAGLRFWWRAFQRENDTKELFRKESAIFGTTDRACPFQVRIMPTHTNCCYNPGMAIPAGEGGVGFGYVFFSICEPSGAALKSSHKKGRPLARPNLTFTIRIDFQRDAGKMEDVLCALWLLANLGGIGGRTRRGAGCFEIRSLTIGGALFDHAQYPNIPSSFRCPDNTTPEDYLSESLKRIMTRWGTPNWTTGTPEPEYTACRPGLSNVLVVYGLNGPITPLQMMNFLGVAMKDLRHIRPRHEACAMHKAIDGALGTPPVNARPNFATFAGVAPSPPGARDTIEKAYLGLPIIYNFRDHCPGNISNCTVSAGRGILKFTNPHGQERPANYTLNGAASTRRASPLLISCHRRANGHAYAVFCYFPARFLPVGERMRLQSNVNTGISGNYIQPNRSKFADSVVSDLAAKFAPNVHNVL